MLKKKSKVPLTKCPYCGEEVRNPNINYCMNCGNLLWSKGLYYKTKFIK